MRNFEDVQRDYHFSYSGADCRVYVSEYSGELSSLRSLSTASISVHEAKAPVRTLGRRSVVGFTESIRTIAGSLVFVLVNDNPLGHLISQKETNVNWSNDEGFDGITYRKKTFPERSAVSLSGPQKLSTLLNPIDLYFVYKTEISKQNSQGEMWVKGVRFINEGIVTSVNDMVTEIVMQFVAEDVQPFIERQVGGVEESVAEPVQNQTMKEYTQAQLREAQEADFLNQKQAIPVGAEQTLAEAAALLEEQKTEQIINQQQWDKNPRRFKDPSIFYEAAVETDNKYKEDPLNILYPGSVTK